MARSILIGIGCVLPAIASADDRLDLLELSIEELGKLIVTGTRIPGTDVPVPSRW